MINVLWIDDDWDQNFIDWAYEGFDINVVPQSNVDEGVSLFLHSECSYDAIILDANCFRHPKDVKGQETIGALGYAIKALSDNKIEVPFFVLSAGEGFSGAESIDAIMCGIERTYDDRNWYSKLTQVDLLLAKICKEIPNFESYKLKSQYSFVVDKYQNQNKLVKILMYLDDNKKSDPSVFNLIRKELDFIIEECDKYGLLTVQRTGANLNECSKALGDRRLEKFIPVYIQRALHSATTICNEGSHRLVIDTDVREGKAPTLVRSTVYEFLNIVYWYNESLPKTDEDIEKYKKDVQEELNKKCTDPNALDYYEGQTMEYEKDGEGNYHCGLCCIVKNYEVINKGTKVVLYGVTMNTNERTKDKYPFFARKINNDTRLDR